MPAVELNLSQFSFQRNDESWSGPISANLLSNGCVVLTGINAGGKTLILKSLDKFGSLLCEPNRLNLSRFEYLFRSADVKSISVTYSGQWWSYENHGAPLPDDWYDVNIDVDKYCDVATFEDPNGVSVSSHPPPYALYKVEDWEIEIVQKYQTRCSEDENGDIIYERRVGMSIWAEVGIISKHDPKVDAPIVADVVEVIWGDWKEVFTSLNNIEEDRMHSFFEPVHFNRLSSRTGIELEDEFSSEEYNFWDVKNAIHFLPRPPMLIGIEEAYQMSESRKKSLREATEDMSSPETANKRLARVYDKALTSRLQVSGYPIDDLEGIGVHPHKDLGLVKEEFDGLDLTKGWVKREREVDPRMGIARGLNYLVYGTRTSRGKELQKLHDEYTGEQTPIEPEEPPWPVYLPPEVYHPSHPPEQMNHPGSPEDEDFEGWDINLDKQKIDILRTLEKYSSFLRMYDSDLLFWFAMNIFFGERILDNVRDDYYSSGQRRIIAMLSTVFDAPHGSTFLIDEPELSLHIDWQRNLIDVIAHSNRRLILATHSPDIIYHHPEKVVEVPPSSEV